MELFGVSLVDNREPNQTRKIGELESAGQRCGDRKADAMDGSFHCL